MAEEVGLTIGEVAFAGRYAGSVATHEIFLARSDGTPVPNHPGNTGGNLVNYIRGQVESDFAPTYFVQVLQCEVFPLPDDATIHGFGRSHLVDREPEPRVVSEFCPQLFVRQFDPISGDPGKLYPEVVSFRANWLYPN